MKNSGQKGGARHLKTRLKTAKGRKTSSTLWLQRQLNDPYVHQAKKDGYRSRAAYKLIEMDDKFRFFRAGQRVLDLGAAPGGWAQVAAARVKSSVVSPTVLGVDLLAIDDVAAVTFMKLDFMDDAAPARIREALGGNVQVILSDMAPNTTGHTPTDHLRIMVLLEAAYEFAKEVLAKDGAFVAKIFQGGTERELLAAMKKDFAIVKHAKPKASRADSAEMYVVAMGFKG
ncbi:MAG: RlmE family RNA methyltransferase [Rickettsiales bacterium]|jgi:23S rRNA (uridine2552-2'-O)-methyltransferase|nr:RlmE family RNA methyltransferase [Rickettsiales bacterium]